MLPIDPKSGESFAKSTGKISRALLRMVDAYPSELPPSAPDSLALEDLAAEARFTESHDGWGELAANLWWNSGIQVFAAAEACAALSTMISNERVFLVQPYFSARIAGEACGRTRWLLDPGVDSLARFIRLQNVRIEDLTRRSRLLNGAAKADALARAKRMREAAQAYGLPLTKRDRAVSGRYIAEAPPGAGEFARRGFDKAYGRQLTALASSAVHASTTAMLSHIVDHKDSPNSGVRAVLGMKSSIAVLLMLAAGAAFKDSADIQLQYHGIVDDRWVEKSTRFMMAGSRFVRAQIA